MLDLRTNTFCLDMFFVQAASPEDAEDGMQFMQEMIELSKIQSDQAQQETRTVQILSQPHFGNLHFPAGPAQFGLDLTQLPGVTAQVRQKP